MFTGDFPMRQTVLVIAGLLVLLPAAYRGLVPERCDRSHAAVDCQGGVIPPHANDGTQPLGLEDRELQQHLSTQGTLLMEQGRTAKMDGLIKQLELDRCDLDLAEPQELAHDPVQVYARARDSVVVVAGLRNCGKCQKMHASNATGFFISATGAILTNYHVVNDPEKMALVVMTADRHVYPVQRILAASRADDLAIIQIDPQDQTAAPLPIAFESPPVGSPVSVISHPAGRFYYYTSGIVSRHARVPSDGNVVDRLMITADFARGSSGAPVFNNKGQVIAVVKSTDSVYYQEKDGGQKNLQMVMKTCIPSRSLTKLIGNL